MYEVAEVDLESVKNEPVNFTISDPRIANYTKRNFHLIIENSKRIEELNDDSKVTLNNLIDFRDIYIRDTRLDDEVNVWDYANGDSIESLNDLVYLSRTDGKLKIYIKPPQDGTVINFGVSPNTDTSAFRYGLLDSTFSTLHVKPSPSDPAITFYDWDGFINLQSMQDLDNQTSIMIDTTEISSNIPILKSSSNWKQDSQVKVGDLGLIDDAERMRFFLKPGESFSVNLKFNQKGSDVFESGENNFSIEFDENGETIKTNPSKYTISQDEFILVPGSPSPIYRSVNIITQYSNGSDGVAIEATWLQVDLAFQKGVVQISPSLVDATKEENLKIIIPTLGMFFEPPLAPQDLADPDVSGLSHVILEPKTQVTDLYKELIGITYANWSGIIDSSDSDYMQQNFDWTSNDVEDGSGWQTFKGDLIYQDYYEELANPDDQESTIFLYRDEQEAPRIFNGSYVQNSQTGVIEIDKETQNFKTLPTTGLNITEKLVNYTNRLNLWLEEKYGFEKIDGIREKNFYKLEEPSEKIGFIQQKLLQQTGIIGNRVAAEVDAIARYWTGGALDDSNEFVPQLKFIKELESQYSDSNDSVVDMATQIKNKAKPVIGISIDKNTPEYKLAKQFVLFLTEKSLIKLYTSLFNIEKGLFDNFRSGVISSYISDYLANEDSGSIALNPDLLKRFSPEELNQYDILKDVDLVYLNNVGVVGASSGSEELNSILQFIIKNDLHSRFLTKDEASTFDVIVKSGDIVDPVAYNDMQKLSNIRAMIKLLDQILSKLGGEGNKTLTDVVNDIIEGRVPFNEHKTVIRNVVQSSINRILSNETEFTYEYFQGNIHTKSTYLENLIIGRNLDVTFDKYLRMNPDLHNDDKIIIESKKGSAAYEEKSITQLAVNLSYYNISYFIRGLVNKDTIPTIVDDILHNDLVKNLSIPIPDGSEFIDFMSDQSLIVKLAMCISGSILAIVSIFGIYTSFIKIKKKRKEIGISAVLTRVSFVVLLVAALVIILVGLIIFG